MVEEGGGGWAGASAQGDSPRGSIFFPVLCAYVNREMAVYVILDSANVTNCKFGQFSFRRVGDAKSYARRGLVDCICCSQSTSYAPTAPARLAKLGPSLTYLPA